MAKEVYEVFEVNPHSPYKVDSGRFLGTGALESRETYNGNDYSELVYHLHGRRVVLAFTNEVGDWWSNLVGDYVNVRRKKA